MASFASLGDVIIAEPKAMVGFAGPRVIKETTHQDLPERFQTAEFLEEHGLIDLIVHRKALRAQLAQLLAYFSASHAEDVRRLAPSVGREPHTRRALAWLFGTQRFGIKLGLENSRRLLAALGVPSPNERIIHVAGTNGKGSVCALLDSICRAAGYRTALFTSPHLVTFRERIRVMAS